MHIIEKLRDIWTRYGGGFNSLSRAEQVEILHGVWTFSLALGAAQAQAYNGMENPYLLANRYIDIMPKVAEQVAKPLTAVDSIKMYGSGNAQKLVKETTSIVDQVASGLKDSTGIDLPSLLNGLISSSDTDTDPAESPVD